MQFVSSVHNARMYVYVYVLLDHVKCFADESKY
jgi:hypothetical protein